MDDPASQRSALPPQSAQNPGGGLRLQADTIEALAGLLDLNIPPQYLAGVAENLERLLAQAKLISEIELPSGSDPAPVFRP